MGEVIYTFGGRIKGIVKIKLLWFLCIHSSKKWGHLFKMKCSEILLQQRDFIMETPINSLLFLKNGWKYEVTSDRAILQEFHLPSTMTWTWFTYKDIHNSKSKPVSVQFSNGNLPVKDLWMASELVLSLLALLRRGLHRYFFLG